MKTSRPDEEFTDSEMWHEYKKMGQKKRKQNRLNSQTILDEQGIAYTTNNMGAHLIVRHNNFIVDFWPGTGKYIFRGSKTHKRGIYNLLKDIGAKLGE